ncbi:hypothetical protein EBU95_21780, partial [bacterium]|nr:hypothetical protein [bacterium]
GAHNADGAWLLKSTNNGISWTAHTLLSGSVNEEPTVKYDADTNTYMGFIRHGGGGNPKFWLSRDNLATISYYSAPTETFGITPLDDACVPLTIKDGYIHAFTSFRSGTQEGSGYDDIVSCYYIKHKISDGDNLWSHATIYRLGTLNHLEVGGASGTGQGSVLIFANKLFIFYGSEERTGTAPGNDSTANSNRIVNLYATMIPLRSYGGLIDWRSTTPIDRSANNPIKRGAFDGKSDIWQLPVGKLFQFYTNNPSSQFDNAWAETYSKIFYDFGNYGGTICQSSDNDDTFLGYESRYIGGVAGWLVDTSSGSVRLNSNGVAVVQWYNPNPSLRPFVDNSYALGGALSRWSVVYAGTGSINT